MRNLDLQANITPPIVVNLGKTGQADVEQLRMGTGRLAEEIEEVMRQVRLNAGPAREDRVFLPIVALYRKARQK
jgi:hypothetical protein